MYFMLNARVAATVRAALCAACTIFACETQAAADAVHAIAMHGVPAMADDFVELPYANPDAPQGGRLVQGVLGTFDSLNPFIVKGLAVQNLRGYVIESLMARGYDEPFTLYGLLACTIETDDSRTYVTFGLNPAARFLRRCAGNGNGRGVFLEAPARSRPSKLPDLLLQSGQG